MSDDDARRTRRGWNAVDASGAPVVPPTGPSPTGPAAWPSQLGGEAAPAIEAEARPVAASGPHGAPIAPAVPIAPVTGAPAAMPVARGGGGAPAAPVTGAPPPTDATAGPSGAAPGAPPTEDEAIDSLSGTFFMISLRRAFRLQIRTNEVLPSERAELAANAKHIVDPEHQAFLAWRRSVLLLVALVFIPLTLFRFIEAFDSSLPFNARIFELLPAVAEGLFCFLAFDQLRNWSRWQQQRRILFIGWLLYFFAPFLQYLYPYRSALDPAVASFSKMASDLSGMTIKIGRDQQHMFVGMLFGVRALLALGPKVISLMPGMIRASIVTKLLFPGTTAPGWLMMLAAPFYALFAYIIVLMPYQITGSWQFLAGNAGVLFAQVFIGISGQRLTTPLTAQESHDRIHKSWLMYIGILVVSAGFMVYGLADFIAELHIGPVRVVTGVLSFIGNVLVLTLIGTDVIVSSMAMLRRKVQPDPAREALLDAAERKLDEFCR